MKNIVIAAGYATRLGELTKNYPKPLLKIGKKSILGRMLDDIDRIPEIDEHVIVTNHKFASIFEKWVSEEGRWQKPIRIVDDGTETNETRLGAVCDLLFAMEKLSIDEAGAREEERQPEPLDELIRGRRRRNHRGDHKQPDRHRRRAPRRLSAGSAGRIQER